MGRHAAGEGFLSGFVRYGHVDEFHAFTQGENQFNDFQARVSALDMQGRPCHWIDKRNQDKIADIGALHLPFPGLDDFAWARRQGGKGAAAWSLTGVNHTIASERVMDSLGRLLMAPVYPWDALVCTSRASRAAILKILENNRDWIRERTGGDPGIPLQLPVIPLGVDCQAFTDNPDRDGLRDEIRQQLNIGDDDVVVLFVGRFSYHAKAHPVPMYTALEEAAKRTGKTVHLIEAGWFPNKKIEEDFNEAASRLMPSVNRIVLDGRKADVRWNIWFAADIFSSLSDNIQETFGLTPIEAMAAGLPVIATDWDGYRDTVRHGEDGILVPTITPPPGAGITLPYDHSLTQAETDKAYNLYCGVNSQITAVDVRLAIEAFTSLIGNAEMRKSMGQAGQARARQIYDWKNIIAQYQTLWGDLAKIRRDAQSKGVGKVQPGTPAIPLRDASFALFESYPSGILIKESLVSLADGFSPEKARATTGLAMNRIAKAYLLPTEQVNKLLSLLDDKGTMTVGDLAALHHWSSGAYLMRTLVWLAKLGLVSLNKLARVKPLEPKPVTRRVGTSLGGKEAKSKPAPKKTPVRKAAAKKPAARKPAAKKTATQKPAAKKPAAKKTTAKTLGGKATSSQAKKTTTPRKPRTTKSKT